jgi:putative hydrolase of the HAD superfamily
MTEALLFDLGGTLDAEGVPWKERFRRLYRAHGIAPADSVFDPVFYAADDALLGALPDGCGLRETVERLTAAVSAGLGVADPGVTRRVEEEFLAASFEHLTRNGRLLGRLRERYRLGLVSNFYGNLGGVCDEAGIAGFFDVLVDSTRVGFTKPDSRIFRHATDVLGVAPARAMFVGDSPSRDMVGARDAGMPHVWLAGPSPTASPCCPGDRVIARLGDLDALLQSEGSRPRMATR